MLTRVAAACVVAIVVGLVGTGVASADTHVTVDARGDVAYWESSTGESSLRSTNIDIWRIRVRYEDGTLVVQTRFKDLTVRNTTITKRVTALHGYRLDTNPDRRGFEYLIDDARYPNLYRIRSGADRRVPCPGLSWRANLDTDASRLVVPRSCLRADERRVVRTRFEVRQTGPGRTPTESDGIWYVDSMADEVVTGRVRHSTTG